ncbi:gp389 [Bacillus phage G]|uniref:Gp389 n=1 Tax=Bacillus phage G TaxID=2884420 RepID=G3MAD0_9CAUD|nr:gp389 [Bacillus phage G]AEO93648.1 gp389 [Bacillus phage G]
MSDTVEELYGLKVGDRVKYVENDIKVFGETYFNKEGVLTNIIPQTGEFRVRIDGRHFDVSFQRYSLILLDDSDRKEIKFEKQLLEVNSLSLGEMKNYLRMHHDLKEGVDYSISERDGKNEVILKNEKYALLLKDLVSVENVSRELTGKSNGKFKSTIMPSISQNQAYSLSFKVANWEFGTHLTPWGIQYFVLSHYGFNPYKEIFGYEEGL